jgi:GT2 family glycosyltransferase
MNVSETRLAAVLVHYSGVESTASLIEQLGDFPIVERIVAVLHSDHFHFPKSSSKVTYVRSENHGYASGLNLAFDYLTKNHSEITVALAMNTDVKIGERQINDLVNTHIKAGADCSFPCLRENRRFVHGYGFSRWGTLKHVHENARFFPATCFLLNTAAWEKVNGFNEEYFHYYEDADFCLRLERHNCRLLHVPAVVIDHVSKSAADYPSTALPRYAVRNHLLFLSRLGRLNLFSFLNVSTRHLLYLFRWKRGWRGIPQWVRGIQEFRHL